MKTIQIRISDEDKAQAEEVLEAIGLDLPTAIRAFLKQVSYNRGIPFSMKAHPRPDENGLYAWEVEEILQAEKEAEKGVNTYGPFSSAEEMIKHLNSSEHDS